MISPDEAPPPVTGGRAAFRAFGGAFLTLAALVPAAAAGAEAGGQRQRGQGAAPPVAWRHAPPPLDTMITRAERVERNGSVVVLEGYAQLAYGGLRLQADRIEINEDDLRITAVGNVVFERNNEKVVAATATANLETGTAVFTKARGILGQDFHFVAETLEELEDGFFAIERGAFTTCAQPDPRWQFTAGRAVVRPGKNVWLRNVAFRVKGTPLFYFPALYYPIQEDGRQTGFLIPRYSRSDTRGHLFSQAFFWAINRSMDATFSVDHFTVSGTGIGLDYRHRGASGSRGDVQGFVINDKTTENREYSISFDVAQRLPGRFRFSAVGDMFSSFDFSQRFQDSFSRSTRRYQRTKMDLGGQLFKHRVKFRIDRKETQYPRRTSRRQMLPQFSITRRNLNLLDQYVQLDYQTSYVRVGRTRRDEFQEWNRLFMNPTLGLSMPEVPFLEVRAELDAGYLRYGGSKDPETGDFDAERLLTRRFYGAGVQMAGPKVERIFETPDNFYAARFKHLVEPEAAWDYRTSDDNFDLVNRFDGNDSSTLANEISFGIVNRLLAKRYRDGIEESSATDVITWRIQQTWYFDPTAGAYDSSYVSSSFEDTEVRKSPIRSDFRFTPDQNVNGDWTMEWDPDERLFTSIRTGLRIGDRVSNRQFNFNWSRRARRVGSDEDEEVRVNSYLRAGTDFYPTEVVRTGVNINYDITERRLSNVRVRADFLFQCCGVNVEWMRYNLPGRSENQFRFGITLGGITSFGFGTGDERDRYY